MDTVFKSKQFWLGLIGLIVLVLDLLFPELAIYNDIITKAFLLIVSLIVGITFNDLVLELRGLRAGGKQKLQPPDWASLFASKQFWLTMAGLVVLILTILFPELQIHEELLTKVFLLLITLILGISFNDVTVEIRRMKFPTK